MQQFSAALHHDVLALLIQVTVLLFTARLLGELARRLGQPSIVGEILAGIVLGPSLLSGLLPKLGTWLLPEAEPQFFLWFVPHTQTQVHLLDSFSMLGALFMMLIAGMEIDLALIRVHARSAVTTGLGGMIVPFAGIMLLGCFVPTALLVNEEQRLVFSLFLATTISVSAIAVIAKILIDLDLMRRDISQIIISAAMIEDGIAWILLSVFIVLVDGSNITASTILVSLSRVLLFVGISFTLGRWFLTHALTYVQGEIKVRDAMLSFVVVCMFAWGALSQALHLEAVLGAFVVGIILSQIRTVPNHVIHQLESVAFGIFAPIFFAVAGLRVNLWSFLHVKLALTALVIIVVASMLKIGGAYGAARLFAKRDHWTALSFGLGLNTHGSVEIIIASIALSKGVFTQEIFSIVVVLAVVTSLIAPTALRWVLSYVQMEEQEKQRLEHEELIKDNLFANVRRVLVPVRRREDDRGGPEQTMESIILQHIGVNRKLSVTLLTIATDEEKARSHAFLEKLARLFSHLEVTRKVVVSKDAANAILEESRKGYDLLVMGATGTHGGTEILFNPIVDTLVRMSPCPSLVVRGDKMPPNWAPRRILAPTNGSLAARHSVQAAFSLVAGNRGEVLILKVVNMEAAMCSLDARENALERQYVIAHHIVDELAAMGQSLGAKTYTAVYPGSEPEHVVVDAAHSGHMDLIILGTNIRAGTDRLYLGSRVERILTQASCPVVIVNS